MPEQRPLVERITSRIRDNPVVATCIVIGFVVIWGANFSEAVKKLRSVLPDAAPAVVAGTWRSEPLKDARTGRTFHYVFELKTDGARVHGSGRRLVPDCEAAPASGFCAGHGRAVAIADGKLERQTVSFACDWGELPGAAPWSWVKVRETFRGTVDGASIRFVVQDEQQPSVEFDATLQQTAGA